MTGLVGLRIVVAGAGAVGLAVSWRLQLAGARVVLADSAPFAENASGVAAGMLAPAFEALLDEASAGRYGLFLAARDEWPGFVDGLSRFGGEIERCGALWVADAASQDGVLAGLKALGAQARQLSARQAEAACAGLEAPSGAIQTAEDWRLEPRTLLKALRDAFEAEGGRFCAAALQAAHDGAAVLSDGETLEADRVVLATGLPPQRMGLRPAELDWLQPIKGQIVRAAGAGPRHGPIVRAPGVYVTPSVDGAAIGATMEPGLSDRRTDAEVCDRLTVLAAQLFPELARAATTAAAGVRASTPDGLPMVGPSSNPGVILALGARRNGWLLAPMIARTVVEGVGTDRWAPRFDPGRFSSGC